MSGNHLKSALAGPSVLGSVREARADMRTRSASVSIAYILGNSLRQMTALNFAFGYSLTEVQLENRASETRAFFSERPQSSNSVITYKLQSPILDLGYSIKKLIELSDSQSLINSSNIPLIVCSLNTGIQYIASSHSGQYGSCSAWMNYLWTGIGGGYVARSDYKL